MKSACRALVLLAILLLVGCVPSLNPVYTAADLIYDASLCGIWKTPNSTESWEFESIGNKQYRLTYTNQDGHTGRFIAHLADVQGVKFLDLYPQERQDDSVAFYKFHLVPIHTIYRLKETEQGMRLAGIDYAWLDNYLRQHPEEIQHSTFDSRRMITASTKDVQEFLVKHQDRFTAEFKLEKVPVAK